MVHAGYDEELFGSGYFRKSSQREKAITKHLSSSIEDLKILFKQEKKIVKQLKSYTNQSSVVENYLNTLDFNEDTQKEDYVFHPINAFHMLQRTTKWFPKLAKTNPQLDFKFSLPSEHDTNVGATNGLADLQEHFGLNPLEMASGTITNFITGQKFKSNSNLTSSELLKIASSARLANYFDNYVYWLEAALKLVKNEGKSEKIQKQIKKLIQAGKSDHDQIYSAFDVNSVMQKIWRINYVPFSSNSLTKQQETEIKARQDFLSNTFKNLVLYKMDLFPHKEGLGYTTDFYLRQRTQQLCRGQFERPAKLEKDLKCIWLHHDLPFLKLGPFKMEYKHKNPEIIYIHDMASKAEVENIKSIAQGKSKMN